MFKFCLQKKIKGCIKADVKQKDAPVAQLDRASDYGSEGCEFESRRARHKKTPLLGVFFYGLAKIPDRSGDLFIVKTPDWPGEIGRAHV